MNITSTNQRARRKRVVAKLFEYCCLSATLLCIAVLAVLLFEIVYEGIGRLNWNFLTSFPSRFPAKAGIKSALVGSVYLIGLTALFSVVIGMASAVYLEELAPKNRWIRLVRTNISNLAGVPSIVYGILGLAVFVRSLGLERSLLAGALTLSLLILPIIIIASQEAIRAVPDSLRHASYALGATRLQTIWRQVLPVAMPGMMTGVILALSRALGEAAPLVMIGALTYIAFLPASLGDPFTALPIQIFNWSSRPQQEFHEVAAAGIIVLLVFLFLMNAAAVWVRQHFSKRSQI